MMPTGLQFRLLFNHYLFPSDGFYFNFGDRLGHISGGGDKWWEYSDVEAENIFNEILLCIKTEALPLFDKIRGPEEFYDKYKSVANEAIVYALILIGDYKRAADTIEKYINYLKKRNCQGTCAKLD